MEFNIVDIEFVDADYYYGLKELFNLILVPFVDIMNSEVPHEKNLTKVEKILQWCSHCETLYEKYWKTESKKREFRERETKREKRFLEENECFTLYYTWCTVYIDYRELVTA